MPDESFYHEAQRALQDHFDSRRIADRLEEVTLHDFIAPGDKAMFEAASFFFLSTVDADGWPDVSYKGGDPGFVQVLDEHTLAFPHFDGNGMFRSLGNLEQTAKVAMLFIDFAQPNRTRVHGEATLELDGPLLDRWHGAQAAVRVQVRHIFPNCPRYVHRMDLVEPSPYVPEAGCEAPVPDWKRMDIFADFLPGAPSA